MTFTPSDAHTHVFITRARAFLIVACKLHHSLFINIPMAPLKITRCSENYTFSHTTL